MQTRKFSDLSENDLFQELIDMGLTPVPMPGLAFIKIEPAQDEQTRLKQKYKPNQDLVGAASIFGEEVHGNEALQKKIKDKLSQGGFYGMSYIHFAASFKLHISLNHIDGISSDNVMRLLSYINQLSPSSNDVRYIFKIIKPFLHSHNRFNMNDQITMYYDKYSSLGGMLKIADEINKYLGELGLPENTVKLGPKDSISSIGGFVTARFDTNKLTNTYDEYSFYDIELDKFIKKHKDNKALNDIPLFVLDMVFGNILTTDPITVPQKGQAKALSDKDSERVQAEFEKVLQDPEGYIKNNIIQPITIKKLNEPSAVDKFFDDLISKIEHINVDSDNLDYLIEQFECLNSLPDQPEFVEGLVYNNDEGFENKFVAMILDKMKKTADRIQCIVDEDSKNAEKITSALDQGFLYADKADDLVPTDSESEGEKSEDSGEMMEAEKGKPGQDIRVVDVNDVKKAADEADKVIASSSMNPRQKEECHLAVEALRLDPGNTGGVTRILTKAPTSNKPYLSGAVKSALIILLGAALVASSIALGVTTFGMSSAFSIAGLIAGVGLIAVGIGVGVSTYRTYKEENPNRFFQAPREVKNDTNALSLADNMQVI